MWVTAFVKGIPRLGVFLRATCTFFYVPHPCYLVTDVSKTVLFGQRYFCKFPTYSLCNFQCVYIERGDIDTFRTPLFARVERDTVSNGEFVGDCINSTLTEVTVQYIDTWETDCAPVAP